MESSDVPISDEGDGRVSVPLMMIGGNLGVLLENTIAVDGVSLKRYGNAGVILVFHFGPGQKEEAFALGFETRPADDDK